MMMMMMMMMMVVVVGLGAHLRGLLELELPDLVADLVDGAEGGVNLRVECGLAGSHGGGGAGWDWDWDWGWGWMEMGWDWTGRRREVS